MRVIATAGAPRHDSTVSTGSSNFPPLACREHGEPGQSQRRRRRVALLTGRGQGSSVLLHLGPLFVRVLVDYGS
jgi:hypothetical protein